MSTNSAKKSGGGEQEKIKKFFKFLFFEIVFLITQI